MISFFLLFYYFCFPILRCAMKSIKHLFLFLYQWLVFMPLFLAATLLTALLVMALSPLFGNKYFGYYPPKWWSRLTCYLALCSIKTSGHENLDPKRSYVFIANHQGAFDIFLVYGFLNQNIKWVQKAGLRKIPFVGFASKCAGHVFVDNSTPAARARTIREAKNEITDGVSIMLFPEGSRTKNGTMGNFKKGAFLIAKDLNLSIVPLTINGPFDVLKIHSKLINPGRLELIIHKPVSTENVSEDELPRLMEQCRETIESALWKKYRN